VVVELRIGLIGSRLQLERRYARSKAYCPNSILFRRSRLRPVTVMADFSIIDPRDFNTSRVRSDRSKRLRRNNILFGQYAFSGRTASRLQART